MSRRQTPARMGRLVAQWHASGESGARFARRHGVPAWTLWYWRRKLQAQPRTDADADDGRPPTTFVPLCVAAEPDGPVIDVVWRSGERLQVRAGAPTDLVRALVAALRSTC